MCNDRDVRITSNSGKRVNSSSDFLRMRDVAAEGVIEGKRCNVIERPAVRGETICKRLQDLAVILPARNEQDRRAARGIAGRPAGYQLILPCWVVSISVASPVLKRNASMFAVRNSRAGLSRTSRPL